MTLASSSDVEASSFLLGGGGGTPNMSFSSRTRRWGESGIQETPVVTKRVYMSWGRETQQRCLRDMRVLTLARTTAGAVLTACLMSFVEPSNGFGVPLIGNGPSASDFRVSMAGRGCQLVVKEKKHSLSVPKGSVAAILGSRIAHGSKIQLALAVS